MSTVDTLVNKSMDNIMNKTTELLTRKAYLSHREVLIKDLSSGVFSGSDFELKLLKDLQALKKVIDDQWDTWKTQDQSIVDEWCKG